jgi:hypothetical protein
LFWVVDMDRSAILERVDEVVVIRADVGVSADRLKVGLGAVCELRSFLDASEADLARRLARVVSFPEAALAETSRESLNTAAKTLERTRTLAATPGMADALDTATVTSGHVDAVTRASKTLDPGQREQLMDRVESLVDVAATATVEQFSRRVRREAKQIAAHDGVDRLARQIRDTSLSSWVDDDGMWNLRGRFDPVTGLKLAAHLDHTVETLFAEATPESCPTNPVEKQKHLKALALARLINQTIPTAQTAQTGQTGHAGHAGAGRVGRPEFVAVINITTNTHTSGGRANDRAAHNSGLGPDNQSSGGGVDVDWPIPIEVPHRVLADLIDNADVTAVVVRNGVVLHAPGNLNLGRTTRLANRAQRRALRSLYRHCAIPGIASRGVV